MAAVSFLHPLAGQPGALLFDLAYATPANLTGRPIYARPAPFLHADAAAALGRAVAIAREIGLALLVFDAFRPVEAQQALWDFLPDPLYVADPAIGSNHSRGTAVDLTLAQADGTPLDMGTPFDDMTPASWHAAAVTPKARRNRLLLLGLMTQAGFRHLESEWWHYDLADSRAYPLLTDAEAGTRLMG